MGEMAEDIINGACCAICGEYFDPFDVKEYGYPVACAGCWDENCGYPLAEDLDDDEPTDFRGLDLHS